MLMNPQMYFFMHDLSRFLVDKMSQISLLSELTKSDFMVKLACEQVLHFWARKCQPIKTLIRLFSHVKKYRSTNQNAHTTNFTYEKYSIQ